MTPMPRGSGERAGFGPLCRSDFGDLPVGHRRQAGEDVLEIGIGIEATAAAGLDDGMEDGAAVPGGFRNREEPVLLA